MLMRGIRTFKTIPDAEDQCQGPEVTSNHYFYCLIPLSADTLHLKRWELVKWIQNLCHCCNIFIKKWSLPIIVWSPPTLVQDTRIVRRSGLVTTLQRISLRLFPFWFILLSSANTIKEMCSHNRSKTAMDSSQIKVLPDIHDFFEIKR